MRKGVQCVRQICHGHELRGIGGLFRLLNECDLLQMISSNHRAIGVSFEAPWRIANPQRKMLRHSLQSIEFTALEKEIKAGRMSMPRARRIRRNLVFNCIARWASTAVNVMALAQTDIAIAKVISAAENGISHHLQTELRNSQA